MFWQEDESAVLHISAAVLLFDGRANESTFELMQNEGVFARLVELIRDQRDQDDGLHKLLLELLFEMSRMQRLDRHELSESVFEASVAHAYVLQRLSMTALSSAYSSS